LELKHPKEYTQNVVEFVLSSEIRTKFLSYWQIHRLNCLWETGEERGHGRIETREVRTVTDLSWLEGKADWKDVAALVQCRSFRTVGGQTTQTDRYYISSATLDARQMYERIRGHWSIENRLHWSLDVLFGEDASGVTKEHGPENLNTLRKLALTLLRAAPSPRSGKKKITGPK
jgi:predicted transposase YbfD/YdcC